MVTRLHAVSELQDRAPQLIREANEAPIGITRYGRMVAALISPEDLSSFQELELAAERALWALDADRAAQDLARGTVEDWDDVVADLRSRFGLPR
jgi:PHD/YefM family antitoxin component YafN of YafNO toxin-antitoxin module